MIFVLEIIFVKIQILHTSKENETVESHSKKLQESGNNGDVDGSGDIINICKN